MRSAIYWGETRHGRSRPRPHSFDYPLFTFALDVDELPSLRPGRLLFGHNRFALFGVNDEDYLDGGGSLREKVERALAGAGADSSPASITLLTMPRYIGYVFNPVSFFVCRDAEERVTALICEVSNTFGEAHVYPLSSSPPTTLPVTYRFAKEFFVSPFFDVSGEYELVLEELSERLRLKVSYERAGEKIFFASLSGTGEPFSFSRMARTALRFPVCGLLTMARIHAQALALAFRARSDIYEKPPPASRRTFRSRRSLLYDARLSLLRLVKRVRGLSGGTRACDTPTDDG